MKIGSRKPKTDEIMIIIISAACIITISGTAAIWFFKTWAAQVGL